MSYRVVASLAGAAEGTHVTIPIVLILVAVVLGLVGLWFHHNGRKGLSTIFGIGAACFASAGISVLVLSANFS